MLFTLILVSVLSFVAANEKKVVCYHGTWATYRPGLGKFDISDINPHLCTHLIYAFVGINDYGQVISLDPEVDLPSGKDTFRKFNALKEINPNLKTLLAVGGWNEGSAKYSAMAADATLRMIFVKSALMMVRTYGFDGFDLDWEYPARRDTVHGDADVDNFTTLIKELRVEFDKYGLLLSSAVSPTSATASLSYDIPSISKYLDFINVMTYDMYGPWDSMVMHNSPLHRAEGQENVAREDVNSADVSIDYWLSQGCPPEKLLMGVPFYGHTFKLSNASINSVGAPSAGAGFAGPYTQESGTIGYNEFCTMLQSESWDVRFDSEAKVPYAVREDDWVSYDDADSLTTKVEYALKYNLGGVMLWSIETDDFHGLCHNAKFPLLSAINRAMGSVQITQPNVTTTIQPEISPSTSTTTTVEPETNSTTTTTTVETETNSTTTTTTVEPETNSTTTTTTVEPETNSTTTTTTVEPETNSTTTTTTVKPDTNSTTTTTTVKPDTNSTTTTTTVKPDTNSTTTTTTVEPETNSTTTTTTVKPENTTVAASTTTTAPITTGACSELGPTRNPHDCSTFYMCAYDKWGRISPIVMECPKYTYWDQNNRYCNYRHLATC